MSILRLVRNFALLAVLALAAHAAAGADMHLHGRCGGPCHQAGHCPSVCGRCVIIGLRGHHICAPRTLSGSSQDHANEAERRCLQGVALEFLPLAFCP